MTTPSSTDTINADELPGREKTRIDGGPIGIAVLDDYQHAARSLADWSSLKPWASITIFHDHLAEADAVAARLKPFDVVCVMRERTPLTRDILERLPSLKLIASTAPRNASIDTETADRQGIKVVHTGYTSAPTIELTWALILGSARHIASEGGSLRRGGWQQSVGDDLSGKTLAVLGLGNVGREVARIGVAFGMNVIAWSENLTPERAIAAGAEFVSKEPPYPEPKNKGLGRSRRTVPDEIDGPFDQYLSRSDCHRVRLG